MALKEAGALIIAAVASSVIFAATPTPTAIRPPAQPTEVKIVSLPTPQPSEVKSISTLPAQPTGVKIISTPPVQPTEVKVTEVPSDPWGKALVIANFALCVITVCVAISQGRYARSSIGVAREAAAASQVSADASSQSVRSAVRETRIAFEREVHVSAHRVMVQATLLRNMINDLRLAYQSGFVMAGQSAATSSRARLFEDVHQQRSVRIEGILTEASGIAGMRYAAQSDDDLVGHVMKLDALTVEVDALKEQVARERDTLRDANRQRE